MSGADAKVLGDINEYGWHVVKVFSKSDGPDFAYSIGLYESFRHPEILVVGLALDTMHQIINNIGADVKAGKMFEAGSQYPDILDNYDCAFREVLKNNYAHLFGWAISHYKGTEFPAIQCVWPNRDHRFPWDSDPDSNFKQAQPTYDQPPTQLSAR
jgi:Domain of unknown function (DUF4262)